MIKFFRSIRKKLITDGKLSVRQAGLKRYMFYAIGEILLVVIGILLALQLNTWNENRKTRLLEKEYLIDLKKEFIENKGSATGIVKYHQFLISNAALILKTCQKDTILPNAEYLVVALEQVGWTFNIGPTKDVWAELNSTGNLRIISNKSLRKSLTSFYGSMAGYIAEEKECASFNLGIRRLLGDILNPTLRLDLHEKLSPIKYHGLDTNWPDQQSLIEELNQTQGVKGYLVDILAGRKTTMEWLNYELRLMDTLLIDLDNELSKF